MKSVALFGFAANTRDMIWQSEADEIWTVNFAWHYDIPRIDRLFDLHPRWHLMVQGDQMQDHWEWLQEPHDFPIYMLEHFPEVPASEVYPIGDVIDDIGREYFSSSVAYMLALAIHEGFDRIELYGIDMANSTEYAYQKANCEYLVGVAEGRGIEVWQPEGSALLKGGLYGYDGDFQMIARQTLEKIMREYQQQADDAVAAFQQAKGAYEKLKEMRDTEPDPDRQARLAEQTAFAYQAYMKAMSNANVPAIGVNIMKHLIDTVDIKEPDYTLHNPFSMKMEKG